jgi:hypothetical protein
VIQPKKFPTFLVSGTKSPAYWCAGRYGDSTINSNSHQRRELGYDKELIVQKVDAKTLRTLRNTPNIMVGLPSEDDILRDQIDTNLVKILKTD